MTNDKTVPLEEVLDAIMLAEPDSSYEALVRWSAKYPEHEDELADFFATWGVQTALPETVQLDHERIAHRVVSRALAKLDLEDPLPSPAPRIAAAVRAAGLSEDELAERCDLDVTLIAKLDRRLIHVATIPRLLLERIGLAIGRGADAVRQMLDGPPLGLAVPTYKSRVRPEPFAQDFADAVRASTLPDEAKQRWLDLAKEE